MGEIYYFAALVAAGFAAFVFAALVAAGFAAFVAIGLAVFASFICVAEFSDDSCLAVPSAAAVGLATGAFVAAKLAVVPPTRVPATTSANTALFISSLSVGVLAK